jgi:hypothetical protein
MTSDKVVGPIEIQQLLELLNASDRDEPQQNEAPAPVHSGALHENSPTPFSKAEEVLAATAEEVPTEVPQRASETAVSDDAENRFAAHIVHGMSKLKGG